MNSRRIFLRNTGMLVSGMSLPWNSSFSQEGASYAEVTNKVNFGLIADPHHDIIHDASNRLVSFLDASQKKVIHFIIQLGDFCHPIPKNRSFLGLWNQFQGPKYHVLGNHDMDLANKAMAMDFLAMESNYYSFDVNGFHFIVLDANNIYQEGKFLAYDHGNYFQYNSNQINWIDDVQIDWLRKDIAATQLPCVVFSHQSLENNAWGVQNRSIIQDVFESENTEAGYQKIIACFNGHNHIDYVRKVNGIYYIDINSMSYQWLGEKFSSTNRYQDQTLYQKYPNLSKIAPYKDPLYAFIEIDPKGMLTIEGRISEWVGPSLDDINYTYDQAIGYPFSPTLSNRSLSFFQH